MAIRIPGRGRPKRRSQTIGNPLEKQIAGEIVTALRMVGFDVSSTQQSRASRQTEGMPDLHISHAAWGIAGWWIEVKRPGERPSKVQREWHERHRAAGGVVIVATSAEEAVEEITRVRMERKRDPGEAPRVVLAPELVEDAAPSLPASDLLNTERRRRVR